MYRRPPIPMHPKTGPMTHGTDRLIHPRDILTALGLLSRLPVPRHDGARQAQAAWAYPVVGLLLGGMAAVAGLALSGLGLPPPLVALAVLATLVALSGALHEDGLADTADGLWGGWTRARRLEIMKDSHIGAYGVVALCLGLGARWAALWLLFAAGPAPATAAILASAALSRAAMPVLMALLPHARDTGLSHRVGRVPARTAALAAAIAAGLVVLLLGGAAIWALLWGGAALCGLGALARRKLGGQTGDILGASQQIVEITVLAVLVSGPV